MKKVLLFVIISFALIKAQAPAAGIPPAATAAGAPPAPTGKPAGNHAGTAPAANAPAAGIPAGAPSPVPTQPPPAPVPEPVPPIPTPAPMPMITPVAVSLPAGPDQAVLSRLDSLEGRLQQIQQQVQQDHTQVATILTDIANLKRELVAESALIERRFNEFGSVGDFKARLASMEQQIQALMRLQSGLPTGFQLPVIPTTMPRY